MPDVDYAGLGAYYLVVGIAFGIFWSFEAEKTTHCERLAAGACWPLVLFGCMIVGLARLARRGVLLTAKATWREL